VSLQLEALDGDLAEAGADEADLVRLRRTRQLVVAGLDETRLAVRALRERPISLTDQLTVLAADSAAGFSVAGSPRPLPPEAALALYRAAQEALTNAAKHAPAAPVTIRLEFGA
jgi:signal transduction histidine kinase